MGQILVVEREQLLRWLLADVLTQMGLVVHSVSALADALRLCAALPFDLVVAGGLDPQGLAALRAAAGAPLLVLTASRTLARLDPAAFGASAMLYHRFDLNELRERVAKLLASMD